MEGGELEDYSEDSSYLEEDDTTSVAPDASKNPTLFSLFRDVIHLGDSTKVANLSNTEIGNLDVSVRSCKRIALIANILGENVPFSSQEKMISKFFGSESEIITSSSMAKTGWFSELFVSQKKFSTSHRGISQEFTQFQPQQVKRKWFQKKDNQQQQQA